MIKINTIKIKRRQIESADGKRVYVYDVYKGFVGMPSTFPFFTKWVLDKKGVSRKEALWELAYWALDTTEEAVIKTKP